MNERVKEIRKTLGYTQKEFAKILGVTQSAVSWTEIGGNTVSGQFIRSLVAQFKVSEEWLRTGEGSMFTESKTFNLDEYVKKRGASELELEIMRAYFSMEPELRQSVISHFKAHLEQSHAETAGHDELAATIAVRPAASDTKLTVEQKRHIVMTELPNEEKGQTSLASTTSNGSDAKLA